MNKRAVTTFSVLLLTICLVQTVEPRGSQKRDLAGYENGGTLDFSWKVAPRHEELRTKLREFLWEHWKQKQLGFIVATFYSSHGDYTTHKFFIEPDGDGRWRVVSEYEGECCVLAPIQKKKRKLERKEGTEFYDLVERIVVKKDGKATWQVLSDQDNREADMYRLRLSRLHGKLSEGPFLF